MTTTHILYAFLFYFRRIDDYESLRGLFRKIKDGMVEKNLAQRLWEMFHEFIQNVIVAISDSGVVDLKSFIESEEYVYIKNLFEASFLGNQLFMENHAA